MVPLRRRRRPEGSSSAIGSCEELITRFWKTQNEAIRQRVRREDVLGARILVFKCSLNRCPRHRGLGVGKIHLAYMCFLTLAGAKTAVGTGRPDLMRCVRSFNG